MTSERVWRELGRASFAVVSHVTPDGEPRCSGVLYTVVGRRMFVAVGEDSWKARHIAASGRVAVTVPVRRGGPLALLFPIPPATITFHGTAVVQAADDTAWTALGRLVPPERRSEVRVIEIRPEGRFLTYGIGVPLLRMRTPSLARSRVPVA